MEYRVNDSGTFNGKKVNFMLFGNPMGSDNSTILKLYNEGFELVRSFKIPFLTVYYLHKDGLWAVSYSHYARITNNKDDAKTILSYATDITDLAHLV